MRGVPLGTIQGALHREAGHLGLPECDLQDSERHAECNGRIGQGREAGWVMRLGYVLIAGKPSEKSDGTSRGRRKEESGISDRLPKQDGVAAGLSHGEAMMDGMRICPPSNVSVGVSCCRCQGVARGWDRIADKAYCP